MSSYNYLLSLSNVNHKINKWKYKKNPFELSLSQWSPVQKISQLHNSFLPQFLDFIYIFSIQLLDLLACKTIPNPQFQDTYGRFTCNAMHSSSWHWGDNHLILQLVYLQEKSWYWLDNRFSSRAITERDATLNTPEYASKWIHCQSFYWMTDW